MKKSMFLVIIVLTIILSTAAQAAVIPAASCNQEDVQAAIDLAQDGDIVLLPEGTATWTSDPNIPAILIEQKAITLQGSGPTSTIIYDITGTSWGDASILVRGIEGKPFRISGISFHNVGGGGITISGTAKGWSIDNCEFISPDSGWTVIFVDGHTYGVVSESFFLNSRVLPREGIGFESWKRPLELGSSAAVFVENCEFTRTRSGNAIDSNHGGNYVFRFNTVNNTYCEAHSLQNAWPASNTFARATRSYEIYHNRFQAIDNGPAHTNWVAVFMRGGTGVIFNNSVHNLGGAPYSLFGVVDNVRSFSTRPAPLLRCDGTNPLDGNEEDNGYPALDQIGRSTDFGPGDQYHPQAHEPLYSWQNTLDGTLRGLRVHNTHQEGSLVAFHIQEGRDFFNDTPRPRYVPHPFPHPATLAHYPGEQRALDLEAVYTDGEAHLEWQPVTAAVNYQVVRDWTETVTVSATSFSETMKANEHVYMVYALDSIGNSIAAEGKLIVSSNINEQNITLNAGWNWVSFHVLPDNLAMNAVFSDVLTQIEEVRTQTQTTMRVGSEWVGDLENMAGIQMGRMYKVRASAPCTLSVVGLGIPITSSIPMQSGWNWVAYYSPGALPVDQALNAINQHVLQVRSQTQSTIRSSGNVWLGDLTQLTPGQGYLIRLSQAADLVYPE